ncbi:MAG: low molecular weight phosphotyrosine protein phosphatase [Anaerolineae bacterium]|nr:MAG: low molecular weight phosphotyrosine protein phosphatase [Anaerolineae bacterium]
MEASITSTGDQEVRLKKQRILFVCLGNIVRSPLAENMFRHLAQQAGVQEHYEVDSAGTGSWHVGEPPDPRMVRVAARHGLRYDGRARQFTRQDFERFDLIIAMDGDNRAHLLSKARTAEQADKVHLLREFDPHGGANAPVPDPYYGGQDGFEEVYRIVERSCQGLLSHLEAVREEQ